MVENDYNKNILSILFRHFKHNDNYLVIIGQPSHKNMFLHSINNVHQEKICYNANPFPCKIYALGIFEN